MDKDIASTPNEKPRLLTVFFSFLRLGATAFGGPAMVAYIKRMSVQRKHWLSEESFNDGVALCQMLPGATAMQTTAYVGFRARGIRGALLAFVGFVLPAFLAMCALSFAYGSFADLAVFVAVFDGLAVVVVAIVANAALDILYPSMLRSWKNPVIVVLAGCAFFFDIHPIFVILGSAIIGVLLFNSSRTTKSSPMRSVRRLWLEMLIAFLILSGFFVSLLLFNPALFELAFLMFRVDLLAFGGGFGSLPIMLHEVVTLRGWMNYSVFMDGVVLGQITPGPIVITATYVGYMVQGIWGAIVATVGIFAPSFLLVVAVVPYFDHLRSSELFNRALKGILASFAGLLIMVTVKFSLPIQWNWWCILMALGGFIALRFRVSLLWIILIGVAFSIIAWQTGI